MIRIIGSIDYEFNLKTHDPAPLVGCIQPHTVARETIGSDRDRDSPADGEGVG
jgi:hypothetical protein